MTVIVMGVAGSGKSTVAQVLARRIGGEFLDADPYHPPANVAKMSAGIPLTDEDRAGWLDTLAGLLRARQGRARHTVLACSALKEAYRQKLRVGPEVRFAYLRGSFALLSRRIAERRDHFMKPGMLESQLATLEEPPAGPGTDTLAFDVALPVETIVDQAVEAWRLSSSEGVV